MTEPFVGIQMGPESLIDEGAATVLANVKTRAACNVAFITTHSFARGTITRPPTRLYPGHGRRTDGAKMAGGAFQPIHPQYYRFTRLTPQRSTDPDAQTLDALGICLEPAQALGIRLYARIAENAIEEQIAQHVTGYVQVLALDHHGRRTNAPCLNHPDYQGWFLGIFEELLKTYPAIEGICMGMEGRGPLHYTLSKGKAGRCFCVHCRTLARDKDIAVERARAGFGALQAYALAAQRPRDGYFVEFLKILLQYPEILAWEQLYNESKANFQRELYGAAKAIDARKKIGWHLWKVNSYDPWLRAGVDYASLPHYADWVKPALYHNNGGLHLRRHLNQVSKTVFGDLTDAEVIAFHERTMGYVGLRDLARLEDGLPPSYVETETRRVVEAVNHQIPVYTGIDVDIPVDEGIQSTAPADIEAAIRAAFTGGAQGIVISRKYSEQHLTNLDAVGTTIRTLMRENERTP